VGIKQGLPYSYNSDEDFHFVPKAVGFFSHGLDPHYFLNPPGYSYLLYAVFDLWFGGAGAVRHAYTTDPTAVFEVARVVAGVLGTAAAWLTYLAGVRLFGRAAGLLAAAILGMAFLPVFYSHLALNDVPALAALSLLGVALVVSRGGTAGYVLAGVGIGLAAATKYTGGITLLCLPGAMACDAIRTSWRAAAARLVLALALALATFLVANPYAALHHRAFFSGLSEQSALARGQAEPFKLGMPPGSGVAYYLWTFTWGLGWIPSVAGLAGAGLLLARRSWSRALVLLPAPLVFLVFMGTEQRFFGRWLMPIFPIVALLAGFAAVEAVRSLARLAGSSGPRRFVGPVLGVLAAALLLAQSVVADVHNDAVLSRPDTRNLARAWMVRHIPAGSKVVVEPVVPASWLVGAGANPGGHPRWQAYPTSLSALDSRGRLLPRGQRVFVPLDEYERYLFPSLPSIYVRHGSCWVMTASLQAGRAFVTPAVAPGAIAYYRTLRREGKLVYSRSPYAPGAHPVPFSFDWSIDYYPEQYRLPGPVVQIYRLTGGRCQGT
jgi:4-amino-4-deoxy-L-arabinose transferase-like glycosyltransferase